MRRQPRGLVTGILRFLGVGILVALVSAASASAEGVLTPIAPSGDACLPIEITVGGPGLTRMSSNGSTVSVTIDCTAPGDATCRGTASLSSTERLNGTTLTAVYASHHQRKRTRRVADGSAGFNVPGGSAATVRIHLDATARRLLAARHKLPAKVTLTGVGSSVPLGVRTLTIKPAKHHKHHR